MSRFKSWLCKHISKSNNEKIFAEILLNEWKFLPPNLQVRERECVSLARGSEQNSARTVIWKMVEAGDYCCQRPHSGYQYWCVHFLVNLRKLSGPLDTVDLEEPPDSREKTGAPVLWFSCEGKIDVWELFSDNSYLSAILDRQGISGCSPGRPQNQEDWELLTTTTASLLVKAQEKESQDCCDVTDCYHQKLQAKKNHMATVSFVLGCGRVSNPWEVSIFSFWDQNQKRFGGWRIYNTLRKSTTANGHSVRGKKPKWIFFFQIFGNLWRPLEFVAASRKHMVPTEWQVRDSSWRLYIPRQEVISIRAPQISAICADQWLPGSCKFEHTRGSSIGHELDQGPTWKVLKLQNRCIGHYDRPSCALSTEKHNCRCSARH